MSIQKIIDKAQKIVIDRRRLVGQTISRSQRIRTAERLSSQPFRITVTPPPLLAYTENRSLVEAIQAVDRDTAVTVKLGSVPGNRYITEYQGNLTTAQLSAMTVTSFTSTTITVNGLPSIGAAARSGLISTSTVIFAAGDFIQPQYSRYPYVVQSDVVRGAGTSVSITCHRPRITSENTTITSAALLVGTNTNLTCVVSQMPTYELGQYKFVSFSGDFELIEQII